MHALIIEDQQIFASIIEFVLRDYGFDSFHVAASKEEAVMAAERRRPDLITADILLEGGCGIEAVDAISAWQSVPVLFITGAAAEVRDRLPGTPVLDKPFSPETLAYAVTATLAR